MDLKVSRQGEEIRLTVVGKIDELGAEDLKSHLRRIDTKGCTQVVIDFSGLSYIGSAGVGKLLLFYKELTGQEGRISLVNIPREVYDYFKLVNLDEIFELHCS